jgi:hypothetical protein
MSTLWIVLGGVLLLAMIATAAYGGMVWARRHTTYTRERFAFAALTAVASLTVTLLTSLATKKTPWHMIAEIGKLTLGLDVNVPESRWSDHALLVLVYLVAVSFILKLHRNWDGVKSVDQYQREQRSESPSLLHEGVSELRRISRHEPLPAHYSPPNYKDFISSLEPVTDSLAWKDQARELLRLSSSSYAFDPDSGWHDKEGCWVGKNVDTGDLVFLYPSQSEVATAELDEVVRYAERIGKASSKRPGEIILAMKTGIGSRTVHQSGKLIRVESESALLQNLVNFSDYQNEIRRRVEVTRLPDSDLSLEDVYVPSRYGPAGEGRSSGSVEEYLVNWLLEPGQRQTALLGEYGQGKSTAALMLTYRILCKQELRSDRVPILIELRGKSPRNLTPLELLGAWTAQYSINAQALLRLHIAGRLLLIFEGFDEMALVGDTEMRLKHFKTLWQFCYPQAKILITGRPNFFLDEEEMKAALGISKPIGDRPYCEAVRLAPFEVEQIAESLREHEPSVRSQICALVGRNDRFRELVSRPSLLHIVAVLWENERLSEKVDKLTSAFIMDLFVRHSYTRQGLKERDSGEFMALTTSEREFFMMGIAAYMAAKDLPNQITGRQLNELIESLIEAMPDSVSTESSSISREVTEPLRRRLEGKEHGVEHVKTDVRACGLLVDDPSASGTFRFGHKSFMEYLFASVVAERIQREESSEIRAIMKATNAKISDILNLPVSIEFLSELMGTGGSRSLKQQEPRNARHYLVGRDPERAIATRLLTTISGVNEFSLGVMRIMIVNEVNTISMSRSGRAGRIIATSIPLFLVLFMAAIYTYYGVFRAQNDRYLQIALLVVTTLSMSVSMTLTFRRHKQSRQWRGMHLWNRICKELGIPDTVLHRVAGTWILPWLKDRPFDYYLD